MGRLITEESVINVLKQTGIIQDNDLGHLVVDEINRIPTAYDVEKVISKVDEALFEFGDGNNCASCAFREMCNDGNDGCIETMAEVFRNTVRIGGVE